MHSSSEHPRADWTIEALLTACPESARVFDRLHMACVGCVMAPHETIAEVAVEYGIDPHQLLRELRDAVRRPARRPAAARRRRKRGGS